MAEKKIKKNGRPSLSAQTRLTRKQQLFVRELVANDGHITLREAAVNAGYSVSSSHTRAYELTNPNISPHVVAEIKRYRQELDAKYGVTYGRHIRELQRIRDEALDQMSKEEVLKAIEEIKSYGPSNQKETNSSSSESKGIGTVETSPGSFETDTTANTTH